MAGRDGPSQPERTWRQRAASPRMVLLTTVGTTFEARLLAARLGSEGVLWELRGASGLYPMGPVHVYVAEDDADVARDLALHPGDAPTVPPAADDTWTPPARPIDLRTPLGLWVVLVTILAMAAAGLVRAVTWQPQPAAPVPTVPIRTAG